MFQTFRQVVCRPVDARLVHLDDFCAQKFSVKVSLHDAPIGYLQSDQSSCDKIAGIGNFAELVCAVIG
jgi:hypothetical protein